MGIKDNNHNNSNICGARTRSGSICTDPPVDGRKRCFKHGCAPGAGAPRGNKNALKHGLFTAEAKKERRGVQAYFKEMKELIKDISDIQGNII